MRTALTGALVVGLAAPPAQAGSAVTWQDILDDQRNTGDVVSYGLGPQGQRYSPLDPIDRANVAELVPAWAFSFGGGKQRGQEAQPFVHDGTIVVTASYSRIFAVDARTGHERWESNRVLPDVRGVGPKELVELISGVARLDRHRQRYGIDVLAPGGSPHRRLDPVAPERPERLPLLGMSARVKPARSRRLCQTWI
jgi:hypothetical protein